MKPKTYTLDQQISALQEKLKRALRERAVADQEKCRRGGSGIEGTTPPLEEFEKRIADKGRGDCLCRSYRELE